MDFKLKEKIYTIPINDAFDKKCECSICEFLKEEEKKLIEYTVGASMMEPDIRQVTNEKGFCNEHYNAIYNTDKKLSCALITETHLEEIIKKLEAGKMTFVKKEKKFLKKDDAFLNALNSQKEVLNKVNSSCTICERLDDILEKFLNNLIFLYETEPEFKEKFLNSKGFCIVHFEKLLESADKNLKGEKLFDFVKSVYEIEINHLNRNLSDLKNFIKKFDHRFINVEFENSKDALIRCTQKTAAYFKEE